MSTTTNLKLFKHDNPTTNTDQFDVEKALNENWDKLDENAREIANKIQTLENTTNEKDVSQDTEIEALKSENTLLKSQIPSATVVGETIHLEDSSNMKCQIFPIGASVQEGTPSIESEARIKSVGDDGSIEIYNGNKNFLNLGNNTFVSNGLNIVNEITKITVTGTLTASWVTASKSKSCSLKAGTYTFSIDKQLTHHIYLRFTFEDGTTTTLQINRGTLSNKIITDKNITQYNVGFSGVTSGTTYDETIYLQLEKGEVATEYTPHQSQTKALYIQQPLREVGDVKDRPVKVSSVWYEKHLIIRKIFNGTENWSKSSSTDIDRYTVYVSDLINEYETTGKNLLCNYFKGNRLEIGGIWQSDKALCIEYAEHGTTTLDEFKTKLVELYEAGTPLYVDYVLAEPILIPCTPEQVEVLESFNTYKNVTNISSDSIGELEVFYYKDIETLNKNNEERILALENAVLGGN